MTIELGKGINWDHPAPAADGPATTRREVRRRLVTVDDEAGTATVRDELQGRTSGLRRSTRIEFDEEADNAWVIDEEWYDEEQR
jgi:hypothetical protein